MKRSLVFCVALLLATAASAAAVPITYEAVLTGPKETPPNGSPGLGGALVTIDGDMMRVQVSFAGLLSTTTASHIHVINGPGDVNTLDTAGPVATTTPSFIGFPLGVTSGSMDQTYDMLLAGSYRAGFIADAGGTVALAEAALFSGISSGRAYLNIHTNLFPSGEIRGFLTPVPEPGSLLLLSAGLAGYVVRRRRLGER